MANLDFLGSVAAVGSTLFRRVPLESLLRPEIAQSSRGSVGLIQVTQRYGGFQPNLRLHFLLVGVQDVFYDLVLASIHKPLHLLDEGLPRSLVRTRTPKFRRFLEIELLGAVAAAPVLGSFRFV